MFSKSFFDENIYIRALFKKCCLPLFNQKICGKGSKSVFYMQSDRKRDVDFAEMLSSG